MKNRWHRVLAISLLLVLVPGGLFLLSRAAPTASPKDRLILTGSSTVAPLAAEIGRRFEEKHPGVRVDVQSGGSSRGIADIRDGLADIGMVSRALKKGEEDLHPFTIARDGIGLMIHADNPVARLSSAQVVGIYTGKITRWSEVGGRDAPIIVVNKAEGRSTLELFLDYFGLVNSEIHPHVVIGENEQGIKFVAGNAQAVAYVSIGTAAYDVAQGVPIKLLPIGGVEASAENVHKGAFPLSRPLNLITQAPPQGLSKRFIDFASSQEVYDIVREQSFVPISN